VTMLPQDSARRLADALSQTAPAAMPDLPPALFSEYGTLWVAILARVNAWSNAEAAVTAEGVDAAITAAMHEYGRVVAAECVSICRDEHVQSVADEDEAYNMAIQHCTDAIRKRFNLE